jgi:hypothetical protein
VRSANWWTNVMTGWSACTDRGRGQVWRYRRGAHVATLAVRPLVEGVGQELVLAVDGVVIRTARFGTNDQEALASELARALEEGRDSCDSVVSPAPA